MNFDFISLQKLGVGCVLVRHSEIVEMDPTALGYTCITLSTGDKLIVEQGPLDILKLIKNLEDLRAQLEEFDSKEK